MDSALHAVGPLGVPLNLRRVQSSGEICGQGEITQWCSHRELRSSGRRQPLLAAYHAATGVQLLYARKQVTATDYAASMKVARA
jgi:hypothetical protein